MHAEVALLFAILLITTSPSLGVAIPESDPNSYYYVLDRARYGLRIRDIINYVYPADPNLTKRDGSQQSSEAACRLGGIPHYVNHTLISCTYDTPLREYNKAIRFLQKRGRIISPDPELVPTSSANGNAVKLNDIAAISAANPVELPERYEWPASPDCWNAGTWAPSYLIEQFRKPFCNSISDMRRNAVVRQMSFFNEIGPANANGGPRARLRLPKNGQLLWVDAEYRPLGDYVDTEDLFTVCMAVLQRLVWNECRGGANEYETRGGSITISDPVNDRWFLFGMDPNDSDQYKQ